MDIVEALEQLLGDLDREEAQLKLQLKARLDEMEVERTGLRLALRRARTQTVAGSTGLVSQSSFGGLVKPATATFTSTSTMGGAVSDRPVEVLDTWKDLNHTEAVARILAEADRPLGPRDVVKRLAEVGRPQEGTDAVRGALGYLKRQERADYLGRGQWYLKGGKVHEAMQVDELLEDTDDLLEQAQELIDTPVRVIDMTGNGEPENAEAPAGTGASEAVSESDAV